MSRFVGFRDGFGAGWDWIVVADESGRRRPRRWTLLPVLVAVAALMGTVLVGLQSTGESEAGAPLSGAIFTTTWDGSIVNENVRYGEKREVYLDGGPPPNAPQTAAGLPDDLYVFQVTDPSGGYLLSEDPSKCRMVRVHAGVIVELVAPSAVGLGLSDSYDPPGPAGPYPCHIQDEPPGPGPSGRHDTNIDTDHGPPAIVIQLMPFRNTPNPGGVYKAWMTPLREYVIKNGDLEAIPQQLKVKGKFVGFQPDAGFGPPRDAVKTDNFKVKGRVEPAVLHVRKVNDRNGNGVIDAGEPELTWRVCVTDPTGVTNCYYTPLDVVAEPPGDYAVDEDNPAAWEHTCTMVDGAYTSPKQDPVTVAMATSERTVVFCNFNPGQITACKFYDFDSNGGWSGEREVGISGWPMTLTGLTFEGVSVGPDERRTGADGCVTFERLVEGDYRVCEGTPLEANWRHTTNECQNVRVAQGESERVEFGNVCLVPFAGGLTMGYWKTHTGLDSPARDATYDRLPVMLGIAPEDGYPEQQVDTEAEARAVFDAAESSTGDGVLMLKAQLLAAKLNALKFDGFDLAQFPDGTVVGDVMERADGILDDIANGTPHSKAEIVGVKDLLDAANNNSHVQVLRGPSVVPCPRTFP